MKSVKQKLILGFAMLLVITSMANLAIGVYCANNSINITVEDDMKSIGTVAEVAIVNCIEKYKASIATTASRTYFFKEEFTQQEIEEKLKQDCRTNGFLSLTAINSDGKIVSSDSSLKKSDITNNEYYKSALNGEVVITVPTLTSDGQRYVFLYSKLNNYQDNGVVIAKLDCQTFSNIIKDVTVSKSGNIFMLDNKGTTIACPYLEIVADGSNVIEKAKTDKKFESSAKVYSKMIAGETGSDRYHLREGERVCYYMPVDGTDGWSLGVVAPTKEMTSSIIFTVYGLLTSSIVFLVIGIIVAVKISNSIANPIQKMSKRILQLSKGDLTTDVEIIKNKDEIGTLNEALNDTIIFLRNYISEITLVLGKISNGDLDATVKNEYIGDFKLIKQSMEKIVDSLSQTILAIKTSSEQVSSGSEQVSDGAQALSQGSTEQASSIEELTATINDIAGRVELNAKNANLAKEVTDNAKDHVDMGNKQMQDLIKAMNEINDTSNNISNIIKTIEDIAFQTNILALNAAVEAARAGSAGKGFAVVADEVRSLANKSAEAAKNTTVLIGSSINSIKNGMETAELAASTLNNIVEGTKQSTDLIDQIADATNNQSDAINQVTLGLEQVSTVVQTNSATAEESAAASEELSGQANILNDEIKKFKLKSDTDKEFVGLANNGYNH